MTADPITTPAVIQKQALQDALNNTSDPVAAAAAAKQLAEMACAVDPNWIITIYDKFWNPIGDPGDDIIEHSGTDPRNNLPAATFKIKGTSTLIPYLMDAEQTLVGVTFETAGMRFPFYVDTFDYEFQKGEWIGTAHLSGIWDILNYLVIWPDWYLPIQAQIFSYAIYLWGLVTVIENMIAEQAIRIQAGLWEFVNNALSLNLDIRSYFGALLESNGNIVEMLKTPIYVVRTNPFLDTSPLFCRTVRMETCGTVIKDITKAYGVDVRVDLWLPGDAQPDAWANLDQPTYVVTVKDRSQVTGPTKTVLDSVLRTVVDLEGSILGHTLDPLLNPNAEYSPENVNIAPLLGVNFVAPWVIMVAPETGQNGSIETARISHHTPKGWQHIIGGRSPKWLNDFINATLSWIIDSITIILGFAAIPSDLLSGFLNNSFLAFQLIENFDRRQAVGPYHPAIEVFHATASAPYNIETEFAFINAMWDSRGWVAAETKMRNGDVYTLGKDIFRGSLVSLVYMGRTRMLTDYVENTMWRVDKQTRDLIVQVGDGKAKESPLAKHQRFITAALEAINVVTLAPQSS